MSTKWRLIKVGVQMQEGYQAPTSAIVAKNCESAIDAFQSYVEWLFCEQEIEWQDDISAYIPHEGTTYEYLEDVEISEEEAQTLIRLMDVPRSGDW